MLQLIPGRVLAQSSALPVEYVPWQHFDDSLYYIKLCVGGEWIGLHVDEKSGDVVHFVEERIAQRFCRRRHRAIKAQIQRLASHGLLVRRCHDGR